MSNETIVLGVSLPVAQRVGARLDVSGIVPNPPRTEWPEPAGIEIAFRSSVNLVDEYGLEHWHEVPSHGQFRLYSACQACDDNLERGLRGDVVADYIEQMPHTTDDDVHERQMLAYRGRPKPRRPSSPREVIAITASFRTGR